FIRRNTGELVGSGVADTVAAGLNSMHLNRRQLGQNVWHIFQVRPVKLDVLPRGYMAITLVVLASNVRKLSQLGAIEHAVGHRNTEHGGHALNIQAVLEAQRKKVFVSKLSLQVALHLSSKLSHALGKNFVIVFVVYVHRRCLYSKLTDRPGTQPRQNGGRSIQEIPVNSEP